MLERSTGLTIWTDREIQAGERWQEVIDQARHTARVAIILVSVDYLASPYIQERELPALFAAAQRDELQIINLLLRPCLFEDSGLDVYSFVNSPSEPLSSLSEAEQDEVIVRLIERVYDIWGLEPSRDEEVVSGARVNESPERNRLSARGRIFVVFSHRDRNWLDSLRPHLSPFERQGLIDLWDDRSIHTRESWRDELRAALTSAAVVILLISPDFLASDFMVNNDMSSYLKADSTEGAAILPLLLKPSLFNRTSLVRLQTVNSPSHPLSEMSETEREALFVEVTRAVHEALKREIPAESGQPGKTALKFYISSTFEDLQDIRRAAVDVIRRLGHLVINMGAYSASNLTPIDRSLADIQTCDAYLGIIAWRYGHIPDGYDVSITELEYEEAQKRGIPRLIFLLNVDAPWPISRIDRNRESIERFRERLQQERVVSYFNNVDGFTAEVSAAVARLGLASTLPEPYNLPTFPAKQMYSVVRRRQIDEFGEAFHLHQAAQGGPFICIVHGQENEVPSQFVDAICASELPRLLGMERGYQKLTLNWPDPTASVEEGLRRLRNELGRVLNNQPVDSEEIVAQLLFHFRSPIVVVTSIFAEEWQNKTADLVNAWLAFWDQSDFARPRSSLFIFLVFCYTNASTLSYFAKRRARRSDNKLRKFVNAIRLDFTFAHGITLSELKPISRQDAEYWIYQYGAVFAPADALVEGVRQLYRETDAIPMQSLAEHLRQLLVTHTRQSPENRFEQLERPEGL